MSNVIYIMSDQKTSHSPTLIRASTPVPNNRSLFSNLSFYAVRRHHSAPQQECRWQQVLLFQLFCFSSLFLMIIINIQSVLYFRLNVKPLLYKCMKQKNLMSKH
jgi:hypothetical protein